MGGWRGVGVLTGEHQVGLLLHAFLDLGVLSQQVAGPRRGCSPWLRRSGQYTRPDLRASFVPFGQGIRNCIGERFAWAETVLVLSAIAARWQLRLADGACVHPVTSSTLVPDQLPIVVSRRST